MKKNLFVTVFLTLSAVLSLTSCTDEKKEMLESLNYKKACELKDFSTAYEIVDLLKKKTSEKKFVLMEIKNMQHIDCLLL